MSVGPQTQSVQFKPKDALLVANDGGSGRRAAAGFQGQSPKGLQARNDTISASKAYLQLWPNCMMTPRTSFGRSITPSGAVIFHGSGPADGPRS